MIRLVETPVDFETCAAIYADVEPEQRVTAEQLATADGVSLLSGDDGMAHVTRSWSRAPPSRWCAFGRRRGGAESGRRCSLPSPVDKGKVLTYQGPLP
jgi:hypothetical protein